MAKIHHVLLREAKLKILARNALFLEKKVRKSAFSCHFKEKYRNFAVEPKH